jgi:hypothetical protein
MRKFLILNAMLHHKTHWQIPAPSSLTTSLSPLPGAVSEHGCRWARDVERIRDAGISRLGDRIGRHTRPTTVCSGSEHVSRYAHQDVALGENARELVTF